MTAPSPDPLSLVDPQLREPLDAILKLFPPLTGPITPRVLDAIRKRGATMMRPFRSAPSVAERIVPGATGAPDVKVYVINADPAHKRPAILHLHGGGFLLGTAQGSVADLQVEAEALDCVIITVDYRLAPETPFPGALEDNHASLVWLYENADALGIDRTRIAVQGESAGGGHAAMLAIAARDRGKVPLCFQILNQPMLDDRTGSSRQLPAHLGAFVWTPAFNIAGWQGLLGTAPGGAAPRGAVPAREDDLSGLPPTFIGVGALDLFVEEDVLYAKRLIEAGVTTELLVVPGAFHGFDGMAPNASVSKRFRLAEFNAIARAFGRPELKACPDPAPRPA